MIKFIGTDLFPEFEQSSMQECIDYCKGKKVLGLDIETSRKYPKNLYKSDVYKPGLDPYLSRIVMVQIGDAGCRFVIDPRSVDIRPLKPILESKNIEFVGHNLKFEYKMFKANYGIELQSMYDTMLAELCLYNGALQGYSLADLAGRYFGVKDTSKVDLFSMGDYNKFVKRQQGDIVDYAYNKWDHSYIDKSTRLGFIGIGNRPFTKAQIEYGADDIELPLLIRERQMKGRRIGEEIYNPKKLLRLEFAFLPYLADIELNGMHFDAAIWMEIYNKKSKPELLKRKEWLDRFVAEGYPDFCKAGDIFSGGNVCGIRWSSSKQVISFFKHLGICPKEKSKSTGKKEWSVSSKAMGKVKPPAEYKELVEQYLKFKEAEQLCTTFGKDFLKYIHPLTKRVHSSYSQIKHTGRISSRNPNCQNIPGGEHRTAFTAPKGHKIANADYDGQETCYLANISQDPIMLAKIIGGEDMHCFVATNVYSTKRRDPSLVITAESAGKSEEGENHPDYKPQHAAWRQAAKKIGFGIPYGKSAYSLQFDLDVSEEEAEEFIELYYSTFPSLDGHFAFCREKAIKLGWIGIDPVTDRRYFYPFFKEMVREKEIALDIYPEDWNNLTDEEKEPYKKEARPHWSRHFSLKGSLERKAQNFPIQGGCGSITKLAVILLGRAIKETGIDLKITNVIHDEINCEVAYGFEDAAAQIIEEAMEQAGSYWCKSAPLRATCAIVDYWKH